MELDVDITWKNTQQQQQEQQQEQEELHSRGKLICSVVCTRYTCSESVVVVVVVSV